MVHVVAPPCSVPRMFGVSSSMRKKLEFDIKVKVLEKKKKNAYGLGFRRHLTKIRKRKEGNESRTG